MKWILIFTAIHNIVTFISPASQLHECDRARLGACGHACDRAAALAKKAIRRDSQFDCLLFGKHSHPLCTSSGISHNFCAL